jgi:YVTN family beta-propeller protein
MDLLLLGPIEARLDDRPISLGPRKQRAVLAMLALEVGHTVSADRLSEGLWGERAPPSAPKLVQLYVSHLRRALDGNGAQIVTRGRGYELRLVDGAVDAVSFERLVEQGRAREALALWRGEPLADVADEPFAAGEIRRLQELRVRAAELAIDGDLAAGRHREVIGELDALVEEYPLRERLHAQRMLALYRAGRQSEALEAYRRARALLVETIGVEPGPELHELHAAVLAQDPALALEGRAAPPSPVRAPSAHRRRRVLLATGALLLFAGLLTFGISRVTRPDRLARIAENAVGVIEPDSGAIREQYAVGRGPAAVSAGGGSVWVANALDGTVTRVDREPDPDETVTIDVGGAPVALAFGAGSLWVADGESRLVAQVDPGANKVQQRIQVGNAPRALAVADGALWVASGPDASIKRIALERARESSSGPDSVPLPAKPTAIAAGAGALWVASEEAGTVSRIEPRSGTVGRPIRVGNGPSALAAGEGAVWVVNRHDGTLSRIDPATSAVSWAVGVGSDPRAVTAGGGAIWVAGGDGTVARVDPHGPQPVETIDVGSPATAIASAGGRVWTTAGPALATHRGGTLRVLYSEDAPHRLTIDWLTAAGYDWRTAQLTSLAYDGLVAYRRVDGASGTELVGDLATEAPPPSRDGRTYVFTLRPGLRFSDGRPVRPEDFRASLERFLRVTGDRWFPPFYDGIVGARRCVRLPARCDLSAGIATDRQARTITIHLTGSDAEFLHKLTLPQAYVVPASTPVRPTGDRAPPGTGPYRFVAWAARRGGQLVRNPYFQSRSPDARPAGFADRIEVSVRRNGTIETQIADVERGAADLAVLADPFKSLVRAKRLAALAARAPGRLASAPLATTDFMFLNVRRRPFDDSRVRRALNHATDRDRLVEIAGGGELATPSCQFVPAGLPGSEPQCRYGAPSGPSRVWRAPDLERARRLVAASGRAGERVVVWTRGSGKAIGRYFAGLLDDLGFRASLRVSENDYAYFDALLKRRARPQIGFQAWTADYLSASNFIEPHFGCMHAAKLSAWNFSYFCDPAVNRQIKQAFAAQGAEAAEHWAAADRRIVDLAPAVPLTSHRDLVFVSKRVGNVQHHPLWLTLLDQLWVQ